MKKITIMLSPKLERLIATDNDLRALPVYSHALALVMFVIEMGALGRYTNPSFPVTCIADASEGLLTPPDATTLWKLQTVEEAYRGSGRIAVELSCEMVDVCLRVDIAFYRRGKGQPVLRLMGGVEGISGARKLVIVK